MFVAYFDEVKDDIPQGRDDYLVGGIVVPMDKIGQVEKELTNYAVEVFGSRELTKQTEFHGDFIYRAKGPFRGKSMAERAAILGRLADVIVQGDFIRKVYAAIYVPGLYNKSYAAEYAFAHFVERVQMCVGNSPCILIGDIDDEQVRNMVRDFAQYRARGTPWAHGIELRSVVDTVHFCPSHHSRLVQLADAYVWLETHSWGIRKGQMAELVSEAVKGKNLFPTNYKHWPAK